MQHPLKSMIGYKILATDGEIGSVEEFYFDDVTWNIRYLVVETGNWLLGRKVLISRAALDKPDQKTKTFSVNLTCDQVRNSPNIDTQRPVYRQHEEELHAYYSWPLYWESGYGGTFGVTPYPLFENALDQKPIGPRQEDDLHLRSTAHISGYAIHATDGEIGHVEGFLFDDEKWVLIYMVVDTGHWLPGKKILLPPHWINDIKWEKSCVYLNRAKEAVLQCQVFDPASEFVARWA